ncbi:beta strand repeat-containing protein [Azospirillum agricola]|uniref:beta strand repeat-containing protein n=1 Tax=Azospirillum agricola TaxID=1720247 RepID=UPI000A0F015D|nr:FG-GAP-like repeat-containing protein [Azospirillum agricola]SMH28420.1 Hemolysin-type calcium-binding repeat-containing protein [Azospirillum lipoferum]
MSALIGTNGNDTLLGSLEDDAIYGLGGDDWLDGGGGANRLIGGAGNDTLIGSSGTVDASHNGTFAPAMVALPGAYVYSSGFTSDNLSPRSVADVNGDGRADLIGFGNNAVYVAYGQADGTFANNHIAITNNFGAGNSWTNQDVFPRTVADVNGDGRADIIGFAYSSVQVALSRADGTFAPAMTALPGAYVYGSGFTSDNLSPRSVADVNGDGRADLIGFGNNAVYVAYGQADGTFANNHIAITNNFGVGNGWTNQDVFPRTVADVNGDGRADIIGFAYSSIQVALSQADGTFAPAMTALSGAYVYSSGFTSDDFGPRAVADINGDGRADIIGFGNNAVYVTYGQADGTFTNNQIVLTNSFGAGNGWTSQNAYPRTIADVNGDGQADIIGFAYSAVQVALSNPAQNLEGGEGDDTYIVSSRNTNIFEINNQGCDTVKTSLTSYSLSSAYHVENLVYTGSENFSGFGSSLDNHMISGSGRDTLLDGDGNDTLDGGAGADTLTGGIGNDVYLVDDVGDVVVELAGEGTDEVRTSLAAYTLGNNLENLTHTGSGPFAGTGNALANAIRGGAGNDTLAGGLGLDTLTGGDGNDLYLIDDMADLVIENAGEGTDEIRTSLSAFTLAANVEVLTYTGPGNFAGTGSAGNDTLRGGAGADTLAGAAGNDWLDGGSGADSLVGGVGNDTYIVDQTGDVVVELADEGSDTVRSAIDYTLGANLEALVLTGSALNATGNELNNSLTGTAGNNVLTGLGGNDTLNGGAGADTLIGGTGNDTYVIDNIGDVLVELPGEGTDTVQSSITHMLLADFENLTLTGSAAIGGTGNAANNLLTGNGAANVLSGLAGDDTLNGGGGADTLVGGTGNDLYVVDNAGDSVVELADEGTDTVNASVSWMLGANVENLTLTGSGAINATGNDLGNVLTGNGGANVLDGGLGADSMAGGAGNDVYIVDDAGDVVTELVGQGTDEVRTSLSVYALGANVERLTYTGGGSFSGTGNSLDNLLTGGADDDTLVGDAGNDTLAGGLGADSLAGGLGDDVYLADGAGGQVIELAGEGWDEVRTGLSSYSLTVNVEALTFSGTGAFAGTGNDLDNRLVGGIGSDTLNGGFGSDTLDGGAGGDLLVGGFGDDLYIVDSLDDQIVELLGEGIDEVRTALAGYTLTDGVEILTYTGLGSFSGDGNGLDNRLQGGAGADTLDGGAGNDTLIGGLGDDVYRIDSVGDVVVETADGGIDEVRTTLTVFTLGDNVERLLLQGGAGLGIGNALDNALIGGSGNDSLEGWSGNDTLSGGLGDDLLTGGEGADLFVFATGDGQDLITDFDALLGDRIGVAGDWTYTVTSDINGDARIVFGTSDALTLAGVQASAVSASWFVTV